MICAEGTISVSAGKSDLNVAGDISLAEAIVKIRKANSKQGGGLQLWGTKIGLAEGTLEHVGMLTQKASVPKSPD